MIYIIRLGHRIPRDERITTHVGLVGRIFGVKAVYYSGMKDIGFESSIDRVCDEWGGETKAIYVKNPKSFIEKLKKNGDIIVHLTMYGERVEEVMDKVKERIKGKDIYLIIGSEKVPSWVYDISTFNIAITNQPHSEIAALAIFLHELIDGKELNIEFEEAITSGKKIKIIPSKNGKVVEKQNNP